MNVFDNKETGYDHKYAYVHRCTNKICQFKPIRLPALVSAAVHILDVICPKCTTGAPDPEVQEMHTYS